ncbi:MAG: hypothetical protein QXV17_06805 [Candidatus Micrarchaeaceae archaeon]
MSETIVTPKINRVSDYDIPLGDFLRIDNVREIVEVQNGLKTTMLIRFAREISEREAKKIYSRVARNLSGNIVHQYDKTIMVNGEKGFSRNWLFLHSNGCNLLKWVVGND